jgi:hypothetical protein
LKEETEVVDPVEVIKTLVAVFGLKWLEKGYSKLNNANSFHSKHGKYSSEYLYKSKLHPVQEWYGLFRKQISETKQAPIFKKQPAISALAQNINWVKECKDFTLLVPRLKDKDEFESVEFEIEVAAAYKRKHYAVEFIDPNIKGKTPDLKVTTLDGKTFYAECKRYNMMTKPKIKTHNLWSKLEQRILNYARNNEKNFYIHIDALKDMKDMDLNLLFEFVVGKINLMDSRYQYSSPVQIYHFECEGRDYDIYLAKLIEVGRKVKNEFKLQGFKTATTVKFSVESFNSVDGEMTFWNPLFVSHKNWHEENLPIRIRSQLKKAVKQIPYNELGVVWIRVPDNAIIQKKFIEQQEDIRSNLQRELSGSHNRRVNKAFVVTKSHQPSENDSLILVPVQMIVEHSNPRQKI